MILPKLKRIKVSSESELRHWLARHSGQARDVVIVTCNKTSRDKFVASAQVRDVLEEFGWKARRSHTLRGNLVGHIVTRRR